MLEFYIRKYGKNAEIPLDCFELWAERAKTYIESLCTALPDIDATKMCICEVAELLYTRSDRDGIESETNDGYSVKYEKGDIKTAVYEIAKRYLASSGALYRGDVCDE